MEDLENGLDEKGLIDFVKTVLLSGSNPRGEEAHKNLEWGIKQYRKKIFFDNNGVVFIKELIKKETEIKNKLSENLNIYKENGNRQMYERTFDLWNKQNLVLFDLKDILCRMGIDND